MCDPIIDNSHNALIEPFRKEVVDEYRKDRNGFSKYPLRHYSQLELTLDGTVVEKLLSRLNIPINDTRVTVFGGYTGQFSGCLRSLGMQVVFTDPLDEWVKNALASGFEAYKYTAEEIPRELVKRTDLFATFECYPALASSSSSYTTLRFLTAKYGILFGESERTRNEILKEEGPQSMLKNSFLPYRKVYSIERTFREKGDLRLYHFCSDVVSREKIKMDCRVMKLIYDNFPRKTCFDEKTVSTFTDKMKMDKTVVQNSLKRMLDLYQFSQPQWVRVYVPENMFQICSKTFFVNLEILE